MKALSSRERLSRLFAGQPVDRIPVWPLFPFHPLSYYADIYHLDCYAPVVEVANRCADIFDRRELHTGFCFSGSSAIRLRTEERCEGEGRLRRSTLSCGYLQLIEESVVYEGHAQPVRRWVQSPAELEALLQLPYEPPRPEVDSFLREQEELGERGLMMVDVGDPLQVLYRLMSVENFALWTVTERELLMRFLQEMYRRCLELYRYLLQRGVGPVYFIVGAEFAGPPVVSPRDFMELSARYVKGIVDLIRQHGMYSVVHYHGNLLRVLEGMRYINPDGLHTVEAPPVGDCTLEQAREVLGDMILIGNIQYDELRSATPERMEALVRRAVEEGRSGRFILSLTAGPYERRISARMQQNYIRFLEAGVRHGTF